LCCFLVLELQPWLGHCFFWHDQHGLTWRTTFGLGSPNNLLANVYISFASHAMISHFQCLVCQGKPSPYLFPPSKKCTSKHLFHDIEINPKSNTSWTTMVSCTLCLYFSIIMEDHARAQTLVGMSQWDV
jgi:hypothetical protein